VILIIGLGVFVVLLLMMIGACRDIEKIDKKIDEDFYK